VTITATVTALFYDHFHRGPAVLASQVSAADGVAGVVFVAVGALLGWKRPANPIGWLMSGAGSCYAAAGFGAFLGNFRFTRPLYGWLGWLWLFGIGLVAFVLLLFPTGALPSRRWRPVAWAAAAALAGWVLGNAFAPVIFTADSPQPNPTGMGGPARSFFTALAGGSGVLLAAIVLAAVVSLAFRYARAAAVEREQLKWLLYAGALIVATLLAEPVAAKIVGPGTAATNLQNAMSSGAIALVPIAIGVAIFRYHRTTSSS
jgi:hypothetical protein